MKIYKNHLIKIKVVNIDINIAQSSKYNNQSITSLLKIENHLQNSNYNTKIILISQVLIISHAFEICANSMVYLYIDQLYNRYFKIHIEFSIF